jgi:hypothetical protein
MKVSKLKEILYCLRDDTELVIQTIVSGLCRNQLIKINNITQIEKNNG